MAQYTERFIELDYTDCSDTYLRVTVLDFVDPENTSAGRLVYDIVEYGNHFYKLDVSDRAGTINTVSRRIVEDIVRRYGQDKRIEYVFKNNPCDKCFRPVKEVSQIITDTLHCWANNSAILIGSMTIWAEDAVSGIEFDDGAKLPLRSAFQYMWTGAEPVQVIFSDKHRIYSSEISSFGPDHFATNGRKVVYANTY